MNPKVAAMLEPEIDISVVVPAYNAGQYLAATLGSILAQQGIEFEVIVVDDCSRDDTAAVVAGFALKDKRVQYRCMSQNSGGPAGPRNMGVTEARGSWIALCDADDLWHPQKLRLQLEAAKSTGADLICTSIMDFPDGGDSTLPGVPEGREISISSISQLQMLLKNRIATSSVMCRRDAILKVGGFNEDRQLVAVEDYDLWLRLMSQSPKVSVCRIGVPLVAYRRLDGSLSSGKWRHARKVMRVLRRAFQRSGNEWAFPIMLPVLFSTYGLLSIYWRVIRGRM